MTSFRISKGIETDLPEVKTDGRMYFCTDTGNIYIDYKDGNTTLRKLVNKQVLDTKQDAITGAASTVTSSNLTANRVLLSNSSGKIAASSAVTDMELSYLDGVKSNIQTQLDNKAPHKSGVYFVKGTGTTAGTWLGTSSDITEYYDGLTVAYEIGIAGASTTTLNINGLGAKTCYRYGTSKITTQHPVGTVVLLVYSATKGAWYATDYDANTNTQVRIYKDETGTYPIIGSRTAAGSITSGSTAVYGEISESKTITMTPSTGTITATTFSGALSGNASTATKATQDASGNVITSTYATKAEAKPIIIEHSGTLSDIENNGFTLPYTPSELEELAKNRIVKLVFYLDGGDYHIETILFGGRFFGFLYDTFNNVYESVIFEGYGVDSNGKVKLLMQKVGKNTDEKYLFSFMQNNDNWDLYTLGTIGQELDEPVLVEDYEYFIISTLLGKTIVIWNDSYTTLNPITFFNSETEEFEATFAFKITAIVDDTTIIDGYLALLNNEWQAIEIPMSYSDMIGATSSTTGTAGLVPAPAAGEQASFLRGDGTWAVPSDKNTTYTFATGDSNGQIKVTPSSGSATNVSVKGLGSAAYATKGAANGVAELDANGRVPSSQLPSYVDDIIEINSSEVIADGEAGKIYVNTDNNKTYRWSGSALVEISASLALGETSSTAYRGDRGKIAYDHSQSPHAPADAEKNQNAYGRIMKTNATNVSYDATNAFDTIVFGDDDCIKVDIHTGTSGTNVSYSIPSATTNTRGAVQIGSNINVSNGIISVPTASGSAAGVTIVYPAASCTTFSSDSGTITPLAAQKAAKMFAITRPTSVANTIPRFTNTTGDVESTGIKIESVTNSKDSSKKAHVLSIPAEGGKKMVYGYCTDQVDGTSFVGGVFDANATEFPYNAGLAIGGTSGNLLWKGSKVITQTELDTKQATITGGATTITSSNLTANRALVSNSSGKVGVSAVTSTELGYLDGVTSNIQTQLNNKANASDLTTITIAEIDEICGASITPASEVEL